MKLVKAEHVYNVEVKESELETLIEALKSLGDYTNGLTDDENELYVNLAALIIGAIEN